MMEGTKSVPFSTTVTFEHTQRGKRKLIDAEGHSYYKHQASKDKKTEYYLCTNPECTGRLIYYMSIGEAKVTQSHLESEKVDPVVRARDTALEKIRTLTLAGKEEGVKPVKIVRSILKELSPEVRVIMPPEDSMMRRVRRWAKSFNIPVIKATAEDYRKLEREEPLEEIPAALDVQAAKKGKRSYRRHQNIPMLKRVDEHGNEIGAATLDEFLSGTTEWRKENDSAANQTEEDGDDEWTAAAPAASFPEDADVAYIDEGGDDFQTDFEAVLEPEVIPNSQAAIAKTKSCVVTTSSNPPSKKFHIKPVEAAVKSGERCFVCGDELIVSETLASSEETFRKACCYLNVKSEGTWFPRTENSKFYSFCESCTNEIMRIHSLYRKVEEIQSLIFEKVESVEKRIADAEIVDNWMSEAPHSTAVRFEGFRKQVLINYRNKLKLRRAIRFGIKTGKGQSLIEIQPCTSAHMFAKNPSETDAFRKTIPGDCNENIVDDDETNLENVSGISSELTTSHRKTRGRPKSKKPIEVESKPSIVSSYEEANPESHDFNEASMSQEFDDDGFQNDYDDCQDAISVTSEKEMKFWQNDPSKLEVRRNRNSNQGTNYNEQDDEEQSLSEIDESDDDDWGPSKRKRKSKRTSQVTHDSTNSVQPSHQPQKKKAKNEALNSKGVRTARCQNVTFPDCVLTKDGRVFMEGVEIIKNPPGAYKPRPFSISYTCGACGKIILGFWHIRQHICGHHLGLYKCHLCQKEFTNPTIVERHITMAHESPTYEECPICGKPLRNYKTDNSILRHRWLHLGEEEKKDPKYRSWCPRPKQFALPEINTKPRHQTFMCGQCGKTFVMVAALRRHEMTHTNPLLLMCQYCGRTFTRRKRLRDHTVRCAKKGEPKNHLINFPCPKCPTRFTSKETRAKHIRKFHATIVNAELPFSCSKCPRAFSSLSGLRHHKRVCIEGLKGYNNKRASDPTPSTSSAAARAFNSEFKTDPAETSSAGFNQTTSQHDSNIAAALGYNYSFLGGGNQYVQSQNYPSQ